MKRLTMLVLVTGLCAPASLAAQVTPATDFFGGVSVLTIGGEATDGSRHTLVGWHFSGATKSLNPAQASVMKTPVSFVGDFAGQFGSTDSGMPLHVYEYMGGVRVYHGRIITVAPGRKKIDPKAVFVHALAGVTRRTLGDTSNTSFLMGFGGGVDVMMDSQGGSSAALGVRTQFDWLPSRTSGAWDTKQFRVSAGVVLMLRSWFF